MSYTQIRPTGRANLLIGLFGFGKKSDKQIFLSVVGSTGTMLISYLEKLYLRKSNLTRINLMFK